MISNGTAVKIEPIGHEPGPGRKNEEFRTRPNQDHLNFSNLGLEQDQRTSSDLSVPRPDGPWTHGTTYISMPLAFPCLPINGNDYNS